jgi:hypothetical protein
MPILNDARIAQMSPEMAVGEDVPEVGESEGKRIGGETR